MSLLVLMLVLALILLVLMSFGVQVFPI